MRCSYLIAGLIVTALVVATHHSPLTHSPAYGAEVADGELAAWVDKRVAERQPTAEDRRFDEIAWVADIRTAQRLAKEHSRPVFLFTQDGRINLGRC